MDKKKFSDFSKNAELKINNTTISLPIYNSTAGPNVIDITNLYKESGYFTYDPGFMSTASCSSEITYIDGEKGILQYRGYNITDLATNLDFLEVAYLLLNKEFPNKERYKNFQNQIFENSSLDEYLINMLKSLHYSTHPMSIMISAVGYLSSIYHEKLDVNKREDRDLIAIHVIAKIATISSIAYRITTKQPFISPQENLSFSANLLHMMFGDEGYKINPIISNALNKILILHADHEQNASTTTVRSVGSSGATAFACISAGIGSLWGPAHGGATEAVMKIFEEIENQDNIQKYINKAKDKSDPFRLMGFGHRVYKNYDPRAAVLKDSCKEVLQALGQTKNNPLLQIAIELEKVALSDEYFIKRNLYPNIDFYSGIIYKAIGIPSNMFTALFATARTVGWISQWKEMQESSEKKICRPRQHYIGEYNKSFVR